MVICTLIYDNDMAVLTDENDMDGCILIYNCQGQVVLAICPLFMGLFYMLHTVSSHCFFPSLLFSLTPVPLFPISNRV